MVTSPTNPFPSADDIGRSTAGGDPVRSGLGHTADTPWGSAGSAGSSESGASSGTVGTGGTVGEGGHTSADSAHSGQEVLDRVVRGAHQTVDRLADSVAPHVQRMSQGLGKAGDAMHSRADEVRELGDEWTESLRTTVREHPVAAVVTALALGVLLARMTA